jgi:hypothetical protein
MTKKKETTAESEKNKSVGSQMKSKLSQRERNLAVKAEMIKEGTHPEPKLAPGTTIKERNLALKAELKSDGKGKTKG